MPSDLTVKAMDDQGVCGPTALRFSSVDITNLSRKFYRVPLLLAAQVMTQKEKNSDARRSRGLEWVSFLFTPGISLRHNAQSRPACSAARRKRSTGAAFGLVLVLALSFFYTVTLVYNMFFQGSYV